MVRLSS